MWLCENLNFGFCLACVYIWRSRRTVGQYEPCSLRRLKQQATSIAESSNIGKISGVPGIGLVGWDPCVQPAGQRPPPDPRAVGNTAGLCVPWPDPRESRHPRSPSSARLLGPRGGSRSPRRSRPCPCPGGASHVTLSWPGAGRGPSPLPRAGHSDLQRWAVPARVLQPPGMLLVCWASLHSSPFTAPCWSPGTQALGEKSRGDSPS